MKFGTYPKVFEAFQAYTKWYSNNYQKIYKGE
jgi:hypothetical protein